MRKLLLLTKLTSLCFSLVCCHNSRHSSLNDNHKSKDMINHSAITSDTAKVSNQNEALEIKDSNKSQKKDSTHRPTNNKAIIHKSPEQDKLDSIKNAKTKSKTKS